MYLVSFSSSKDLMSLKHTYLHGTPLVVDTEMQAISHTNFWLFTAVISIFCHTL